jgi:hypothetical protein
MKIVYIGLKDIKADNVAGTGLFWKRGDIHEVADPAKAAKLLEHKLIWANADEKYEMIPEPTIIPSVPRVQFFPAKSDAPYWEPIILTVSPETFEKLRAKELTAIFVEQGEVDEFAEWKLDKATRPDVTTPQETGPRPQDKETRPGLEKAKKVA